MNARGTKRPRVRGGGSGNRRMRSGKKSWCLPTLLLIFLIPAALVVGGFLYVRAVR